MTFGQEIDQLIARTKQAQHKEYSARHKLDEMLKEIFLAFDHLCSLDSYFCEKHYCVDSYTIERDYDNGGRFAHGAFIRISSEVEKFKKVRVFLRTKEYREKYSQNLKITCSDWLDEKTATYELSGDESYIQETLPIWSDILKGMAQQIAERAESITDKIESKREAGLYLLED